ncbi:hypothetical protein SDJN02_15782, partial [Cucurbita argyrosperma subsp. argyrosperma]
MAAYTRSTTFSDQWLLATIALIISGFLAYAIYDAAIASASEVLQRLVIVSPLLLVVVVHWLSLGGGGGGGGGNSYYSHNQTAVGFPWGVGFLLLLLLFPWSAAILLLMLYFFFLTN